MSRIDILFETSRFNLSEVGEDFINPCCFGRDAASWLRDRLSDKGVIAQAPGQEDWGWYLFAEHDSRRYFLGISGNRDEQESRGNDGTWRIMPARRRSLMDRLLSRNLMTADDPILVLIEGVLKEQSDIRNVRREIA
jgi:hypothetical protein